jgi:hypothetical protein
MKVCKECKIEFEPDNSKAMFCSAKCRQKDYRKSVAAKLRELKEVKLQDLTKNNAVAAIEPQGEAKSNYSINTTEKKEEGLNEIELAFLAEKAKYLKNKNQ